MTRFAILLAVLAIAGCSGGSLDFSIDNPTDAPISLTIDDTHYDVPAHQAKDISLAPGEHRMESSSTGKIKFIVYAGGEGALINPTLSDYVIADKIYLADPSKRTNFGAVNETIQLQGVAFQGPFALRNALFIEKKWRFGVHQPFPHELTGYDPGTGGNIFSKIFATADFVPYYEEAYGKPGYFQQHHPVAETAPRHPAGPPALPVFDSPEMQQASAPLRDLLTQYLHATDASEQARLKAKSFDLVVAFVHYYAEKGMSFRNEGQKYNDFMLLHGELLSASAIVEN